MTSQAVQTHSDDSNDESVHVAKLFAIADLSILVPVIYLYAFHITWTWSPTFCFLLLSNIAIGVSVLIWWRQSRCRFWFTYLLFPIRILTGTLSFAWLAKLILFFLPSTGQLNSVVWAVAMAIEVLRLLFTFALDRNRRDGGNALQALPVRNPSVRVDDPYRPPTHQ